MGYRWILRDDIGYFAESTDILGCLLIKYIFYWIYIQFTLNRVDCSVKLWYFKILISIGS